MVEFIVGGLLIGAGALFGGKAAGDSISDLNSTLKEQLPKTLEVLNSSVHTIVAQVGTTGNQVAHSIHSVAASINALGNHLVSAAQIARVAIVTLSASVDTHAAALQQISQTFERTLHEVADKLTTSLNQLQRRIGLYCLAFLATIIVFFSPLVVPIVPSALEVAVRVLLEYRELFISIFVLSACYAMLERKFLELRMQMATQTLRDHLESLERSRRVSTLERDIAELRRQSNKVRVLCMRSVAPASTFTVVGMGWSELTPPIFVNFNSRNGQSYLITCSGRGLPAASVKIKDHNEEEIWYGDCSVGGSITSGSFIWVAPNDGMKSARLQVWVPGTTQIVMSYTNHISVTEL